MIRPAPLFPVSKRRNRLSSKQVAAEVFVSVKTVEGHLSRIYRKLGIHSRAALAAKLAEERLAGTRR